MRYASYSQTRQSREYARNANTISESGSRLGKSRFPIARTVFGFDLFNITAVDYKIGSYKTGQNRLFSELMHQFNAGDVIVGDRRFAGAKLYVDYIRA